MKHTVKASNFHSGPIPFWGVKLCYVRNKSFPCLHHANDGSQSSQSQQPPSELWGWTSPTQTIYGGRKLNSWLVCALNCICQRCLKESSSPFPSPTRRTQLTPFPVPPQFIQIFISAEARLTLRAQPEPVSVSKPLSGHRNCYADKGVLLLATILAQSGNTAQMRPISNLFYTVRNEAPSGQALEWAPIEAV